MNVSPSSASGNKTPHQSTISCWYGEFKRQQTGPPKTAVAPKNIDALRNIWKIGMWHIVILMYHWRFQNPQPDVQKKARINRCKKKLI